MRRPDWARTQDKIAVVALDFGDIWVIDLADPLNPVNLTNTLDIGSTMPSWSPDDTKIVFTISVDIYVMNADGSGVTQIAKAKKNVFRLWTPDWRRCCRPEDGQCPATVPTCLF